ncbi:MAG TPA: hypothetical protein VNW06_03570 [Cytophagaceae bacterium]|jgi:hypothetical protein|nr:hypothetical protein [Cytophagaceae bacterium]
MEIANLNVLKSKVLIILYLKNKALLDPYKGILNIKLLDTEEKLKIVIEDLRLEKLIETDTTDDIKLTLPGLYEVEVRYFNRTHSGNVNIVNISQMVNSAIQQGSPNGNISLTPAEAELIQKFIITVDDNLDLNIINKAMISGQNNADRLIKKYYKDLLNELKTFRIESFDNVINRQEPWGTKVENNVHRMLPLRDKFLDLFYSIIDNSNETKQELLHNLLQQLLQFNYIDFQYFSQENTEGYLRSENYRIFIYEVFLCLSTYLLKEERFEELAHILHHPYQIQRIDEWSGFNDYQSVTFSKFNFPVSIINDVVRKNTLNLFDDSKHLLVEFLKLRNKDNLKISWTSLKETDILLYYISVFNVSPGIEPIYWTPYLSLDKVQSVNVMKRSVSRNYFNKKVILLFNEDSFDEFAEKAMKIPNLQSTHYYLIQQYRIQRSNMILNLELICTQP